MHKNEIAFITGVGHLPNWCGISESLYQILNHLSSNVLTITAGKNGLYKKLNNDGKRVIKIDFNISRLEHLKNQTFIGYGSLITTFIIYQIKLLTVLIQNQTKTVYVSDPFALFLSFIPCKIIMSKIIVAVRGRCESLWIIRLLLHADRIVVLSGEMKDALLQRASKLQKREKIEKKITIIYNGIKVPDLKKNTEKEEMIKNVKMPFLKTPSSILLLYVGFFNRQKGQLEFITRVLPLLHENIRNTPEIHTIFVGAPKSADDEYYFNQCKEVVKKNNMDRFVYFSGFQKNVSQWYLSCDIVVLASQLEGQPRAVLEAMAYMRPVVAYEVFSVNEMLVRTNAGIVVKQDDAKGMAEAIHLLALDKRKRENFGKNGRKFIEQKMNIVSIADKYETLFKSVHNDRL